MNTRAARLQITASSQYSKRRACYRPRIASLPGLPYIFVARHSLWLSPQATAGFETASHARLAFSTAAAAATITRVRLQSYLSCSASQETVCAEQRCLLLQSTTADSRACYTSALMQSPQSGPVSFCSACICRPPFCQAPCLSEAAPAGLCLRHLFDWLMGGSPICGLCFLPDSQRCAAALLCLLLGTISHLMHAHTWPVLCSYQNPCGEAHTHLSWGSKSTIRIPHQARSQVMLFIQLQHTSTLPWTVRKS